jgi:hypothetical protein
MGDCSDILYEDKQTSWDYVLEDIAKREKMGYNKYGKYLTANTNEDMLNHAYNEALDLVVYLRTLLLQKETDYNPHL